MERTRGARWRPWDAATVYLLMTGALALFGATIFTLAAVYRVRAAGLGPLQLVLVGTVMEASIVLFEVPTGVVADTYSRRASIVLGVLIMGAASALEGLVPVFASILLAQAVWGLGYTFTSGATQAWIAGEVGDARLGAVLLRGAQVAQLAGLAGIGLSVLLAGAGLGIPLVAGGLSTMAVGGFLALAMPETGFRRTVRRDNAWQEMGRTLGDGWRAVKGSPLLLTIIAVAAFSGASTEGIDRLWQAHLLANVPFPTWGGLPPVAWFGLLSAGVALLSIGATEVARRRVDTSDRRVVTRALLALLALRVAGLAVFGLAAGFLLAVSGYLGTSVTRGVGNSLYNTWLTQQIAPRVRATVLSMAGQVDAISQVLGGPLLGAVGQLSLRWAMVAAGLALLPALWLVARARRLPAPAGALRGDG